MGLNQRFIRQYQSGILVSLSPCVFGMSLSWLSITETVLKLEEGFTDNQISWLGSIPSLGCIFGAFIWSAIINKIGRKKTAALTMFPFFISNLIYILTRNFYWILFSRFLTGIASGGSLINTPAYITETCEDKYKSTIFSISYFIISLGAFFMYTIASNTYFHFNLIISIIPIIIAIIILYCIPESPIDYMKINNDNEAIQILYWLRASNNESYIQKELNKLKESFLNITERQIKIKCKELISNNYYRKTFLICLILQSSISMSGMGTFLTYLNNILELATHETNTNQYAIILSSFQFLGSFISCFIFHSFNRKTLMIFTNFIVFICLLTSSVYLFYIKSLGISPCITFIILIFSIYMFIQGIGLSTIVYTVIPELLSIECRNQFLAMLMFFHFIITLFLNKMYPFIISSIMLPGMLFIFSLYLLFTTLFGIFYLPETKNKTIQEILNQIIGENQIESIPNDNNNVENNKIEKNENLEPKV